MAVEVQGAIFLSALGLSSQKPLKKSTLQAPFLGNVWRTALYLLLDSVLSDYFLGVRASASIDKKVKSQSTINQQKLLWDLVGNSDPRRWQLERDNVC